MTKPTNPWPSINPGMLRHQIAIQAQSSAQDSVGQSLLTWNTVRTTNGGLNVVTMKEAFGEGQLTAQETDIWTVRWSSVPILPGMQIVFGGQTWKVQVPNNVARRNVVVHMLCLLLNGAS